MASLADLYPDIAFLEGSQNLYRDESGVIRNQPYRSWLQTNWGY